MATGIEILLKQEKMQPEDIEEILLAGVFGNYLNTVSVQRIGIIPHIPLDRIRSIGNAAGQGA